jgi:hypothetical protein
MSSSYPRPGQPSVKGPSRAWTVAAVALLAVGLVLTGFFAWKAFVNRPASPQPVEAGPVRLDREGLTIYSSQPVLRPPCEVKDSTGADIPLEAPSGSETITVNSGTWYVVLRSAEPVPAGEYSVSCSDDETNATYAAGPRFSVLGFAFALLGAIGSFVVFGLLGTVILVVVGVKRRRTNRPSDNSFPGSDSRWPRGNTFPGGSAPYPPGGTPYPQGGTPYPQGSTPYPPSGTPYPQGGAYPQGGTPYPASSAPYPQGGTPYPPGGTTEPQSGNAYPSRSGEHGRVEQSQRWAPPPDRS